MAEAPLVLTSKKIASPFLLYQREWINDDAPMKLAEKSRRIGWTYAESYDATSSRFRPHNPRNVDYWFSSADESAAAEFIEYCRFWAQDLFGKVADYFTEQVEDETTRRVATAFCIRCPNGKRITAMTSHPRRFRSKGGDVCLDEAAYHDDAAAMYKAAKPATMRGGRMRIFSTHNGEEHLFNRFVKMAHQILRSLGLDPEHPPADLDYALIQQTARMLRVVPWKLHRVTILDAVEQGLVENINRYQGTRMTREEFLADCRAGCLDEDMWNQEFMCIPSVGTAALLSYELIAACERDELAGAIDGLDVDRLGDGPKFLGMDIGRRKDLTVLWLVERVGEQLVTRGVKWMERAPFRVQGDELCRWINTARPQRVCIDASGLGMQLAEAAVETYGSYRVEPVTFSAKVKEALAMPMRAAFEDRGFLVPPDSRIREGLHKIRKVTTAAGNLRFEAERDEAGHADEFWAAALARHAAGDWAGPAEYMGSERKLAFAREGIW